MYKLNQIHFTFSIYFIYVMDSLNLDIVTTTPYLIESNNNLKKEKEIVQMIEEFYVNDIVKMQQKLIKRYNNVINNLEPMMKTCLRKGYTGIIIMKGLVLEHHILQNIITKMQQQFQHSIYELYYYEPYFRIQIKYEFKKKYISHVDIQQQQDDPYLYNFQACRLITTVLNKAIFHDNYISYSKLKNNIQCLNDKVNNIENKVNQIYYAPGMPGYLESIDHLNNLIKIEKK